MENSYSAALAELGAVQQGLERFILAIDSDVGGAVISGHIHMARICLVVNLVRC